MVVNVVTALAINGWMSIGMTLAGGSPDSVRIVPTQMDPI